MNGDLRSAVTLFDSVLLPLTSIPLTEWILHYGVWVYVLIFLVIMLASTIAGGPIPDNSFLVLLGAGAVSNSLSLEWLFVMAFLGGFTGYEINYWSGRLFGLTVCRGVCPVVLREKNVAKALGLMDRYGPAALVMSRLMPVLNLPSFIAGMNSMEHGRYAGFNLVSSAAWSGGLLALGFYLGSLSFVSGYIDLLTDLFIIILAAGIILAIVMAVRDYSGKKPEER